MLASTVQFSSYDRPQHPHPSAYPHHQHLAALTVSAVRPSGTSPQSLEPPHHPQAATRLVATPRQQPSGCSLRTQQRARPTPNPSSKPFPPEPPEEDCGVLGATSSKA